MASISDLKRETLEFLSEHVGVSSSALNRVVEERELSKLFDVLDMLQDTVGETNSRTEELQRGYDEWKKRVARETKEEKERREEDIMEYAQIGILGAGAMKDFDKWISSVEDDLRA